MRPETKAKYPDNWKEISRQTIRSRNYTCQFCRKPAREVPHLTVHHIDYDPSNNHPSNLYVCCPKCHFYIQAHYIPSDQLFFFFYTPDPILQGCPLPG